MNTLEQLSKQWFALQPLTTENQERLNRKFNLEFNYNSNHLEGNTLTYGQTALLLFFDETTGDAKFRDYEEMKAHNVALKLIQQVSKEKERPLSETFIRDINQIILVEPFFTTGKTPSGKPTRIEIKIGTYKTRPNHVETATGEIFHYATPEETPAMMNDLIKWYNEEEEKANLHPIELAALFHYRYIRIHPFEDGNGRIARLLVNYILLRHNYPMIIIKSDKEEKDKYLHTLRRCDIAVGLTPSDGATAQLAQIQIFADYMKEQLSWSLQIGIRAAKGENIDEPDDWQKKLHLLKKELGEQPDDTIKLVHNKDTVDLVIENSILPLLEAWKEQLKNFEVLFLDKIVRLTLHRAGIETKSSDSHSIESVINTLKKGISNDVFLWEKINISVNMQGLRNFNNNTSISGGEIIIDFFQNAYEIKFTGGEKPINKLYHQNLSESEIKTIISTLGNFLFNNIEEIRKIGS